MGIIKQLDKRTGITYVYESKAYWDKEKQQSRAKRTLIGKIDPETGEMIPTDGRHRKTEEPSEKEAKRELKNFLRRISRDYEKIEKEFKYIAVTEYKNHRIHHHVVIPFIDSDVVQRQWKRGRIRGMVPLDRSRNYKKLASYLIKETTKTMREQGNETKKRWSSSKNLIRPVVKREIVQAKAMYEQPKAFKGYEIDQDTIRKFEHPFTGIEHLEYMMVSSDPVPRLKSWRKGTIIDRQETLHRAAEVQISIDDLDGWYYL